MLEARVRVSVLCSWPMPNFSNIVVARITHNDIFCFHFDIVVVSMLQFGAVATLGESDGAENRKLRALRLRGP